MRKHIWIRGIKFLSKQRLKRLGFYDNGPFVLAYIRGRAFSHIFEDFGVTESPV